jgi:S1-C subfamily serine protease
MNKIGLICQLLSITVMHRRAWFMREIRRKNPRARDNDVRGALDDVNEQELAKDAGGEYEERQSSGTNEAEKVRDELANEAAPLPLTVDKKEEQITLARQTSKENPREKEEEDSTEAKSEREPHAKDAERADEPRTKRRGGFYVAFIVICALLSAAVVLYSAYGTRFGEQTDGAADDGGSTDTPDIQESITDSRTTFEKMTASAVTVRCRTKSGTKIGSGTAVFDGGYIATLWDTVDGAQSIEIILGGKDIRRAELVGGSSLSELALLKTEGEGLCVPTISGGISTGDTVYAVGALGDNAAATLPSSLCKGSVAYKERRIRVDEGKSQKLMKAIQLDGFNTDSLGGCPVFNEDGDAVAIMVNIGNTDASFALPIEEVLAVLLPIKDGQTPPGEAVSAFARLCPRLGVECEESANGVKIVELYADTDAALKLKVGDIIIKVGEKTVSDVENLRAEIETHQAYESVEIFVYRNAQLLSFYVILCE